MPVILNATYPGPERRSGLNWPRVHRGSFQKARGPSLHIGLVNNMGDAAMGATESQFLTLLEAAAGDLLVYVTLYALPEVERKPLGQRRVASFYSSIEELWEQPPEQTPDGLIVTGREPLRSDLREEAYWPSFLRLIDWTQEHARSAVWSCLAAHAAVLALDGIERVRSRHKHFGILECEQAAPHPLLAGASANLRIPHSRWNGLPANQLIEKGYRVLTRTGDGGVDTFVKQEEGLFVFFQGHPEYESETLLGEYRRDVGRYLKGEMENYPLLPQNYFDEATETSLREIEDKARAARDEKLLGEVHAVLGGVRIQNTWRCVGTLMYRNWLKHLSMQKKQSDQLCVA
ncbi:MAG TPA: homoserine O-succinyltransferase [Urbifossiella sp.]|nr:homoserine O-succinyltransferase [Urbifossiella sp.]